MNHNLLFLLLGNVGVLHLLLLLGNLHVNLLQLLGEMDFVIKFLLVHLVLHDKLSESFFRYGRLVNLLRLSDGLASCSCSSLGFVIGIHLLLLQNVDRTCIVKGLIILDVLISFVFRNLFIIQLILFIRLSNSLFLRRNLIRRSLLRLHDLLIVLSCSYNIFFWVWTRNILVFLT